MGNSYKIKIAQSAATEVTVGMSVKNWTPWDGVSEIATTNGYHITIVECDEDYKAVKSVDVTAEVNAEAR